MRLSGRYGKRCIPSLGNNTLVTLLGRSRWRRSKAGISDGGLFQIMAIFVGYAVRTILCAKGTHSVPYMEFAAERGALVFVGKRYALGNCSCIALPPASMQSSAIAPALLSIACSRRDLPPPSRGRTSCIHAVVGNCSVHRPPLWWHCSRSRREHAIEDNARSCCRGANLCCSRAYLT
jgi:hypothetical protein